MTDQCTYLRCGQTWPRNPMLEVVCPTCGAPVGQYCRRPSGYSGPFVEFHVDREKVAMERGFLQR